MPASPNILFFLNSFLEKQGKSYSFSFFFFFPLPVSGNTKKHKSGWVERLESGV